MKNESVCDGCSWAKNRDNGACYCTKYGIIIGYPKLWCMGRDGSKEDEQVQEQKDNS